MKQFVALTLGCGRPVYYRKEAILIVRPELGFFNGHLLGSVILDSEGGGWRFVTETPEQVMAMIEPEAR